MATGPNPTLSLADRHPAVGVPACHKAPGQRRSCRLGRKAAEAVNDAWPDGLAQAFTTEARIGFALAVQWHAEWRAAGHPVSRRLFGAFGQTPRNYRDRVRGPLPA